MILWDFLFCQAFCQYILHRLRGENLWEREISFILSESGDRKVLPDCIRLEILFFQPYRAHNLSHPIGSVIEEQQGISILDGAFWIHNNGFQELVRLLSIVAGLDGV
eukprot:Lithocolla_globosa_v1_NODE_3956_length_1544_cov_5.267965.p2 type:complete len:107 gc:universal NODE_3956_length_1544_cov_5.267965:997-677(-)